MRQLKEWGTRELRRHGLANADTPVWTERGSRKNLWNSESLRRAVEYVMQHQGGDLE